MTETISYDQSWRTYMSRLLATDWDNPDDVQYDEDD